MANLKSSKKDVRRIAVKTVVNKSVRTSLKTYIKKVKTAAANADGSLDTVIANAAKQIDKAAKRGIIHKNQAARRKSRMMKAAHVARNAEPVVVEQVEKVAKAPKSTAAKSAKPAAKAAAKPAAKATKAKK